MGYSQLYIYMGYINHLLTDMHIQVSRRWSGFPEIGCSFSTKHPCVLSQLGRPTILRLSWWKPWGKSSWKSWGANMDLDRGFLEIWPPNHGDLIISWCSWWKKGCHHRILKKNNVDLEFFRARDGIFDHQTSTFSCAQWLDLLCFLTKGAIQKWTLHRPGSEVAKFLGARRPFPESYRFRRRQYRFGHRTDLCQNASLEAALKPGWREWL